MSASSMRAPGAHPLSRMLSNNQISVSHEVSVVSSRRDSPTATNPSSSVDVSRSSSTTGHRPGPITIAPARARNGHITTHSLDRLSAYSRQNSFQMERDRQSVRELAEFLRTREPPKDNLMSLPDYPAPRNKLSPFRIFGRKNSIKNMQQKPLQLPDSAVAAKTIEGHWHIAISIPNEYDLLDGTPRTTATSLSSQRPNTSTTRGPRPSRDGGPITVLKPVNEDRPLSVSADFNPGSIISRAFANESAAREANTHGSQDPARPHSGFESSSLPSTRPSRTYIAVTPDELNRQNSTRSDRRHSGGTAYSERTLETEKSHSRGPSSVSTAPSNPNNNVNNNQFISLRGIEPPARFSSKTQTSNTMDTSIAGPSGQSQKRASTKSSHSNSDDSISSDASDGHLAVADLARNHGSPDIITASRHSPRQTAPGPAPSCKLPDLPEASDDGTSSRKSQLQQKSSDLSPIIDPIPAQSSPNGSIHSDGTSRNSPGRELNQLSRDKRQERVKALRVRDMEKLKEKHRATNSSESPNTAKVRSPSSSKGSRSKHRSLSASPSPTKSDRVRRRNVIGLSQIMLVTEIEPDYELTSTGRIEAALPPPRRRDSMVPRSLKSTGEPFTSNRNDDFEARMQRIERNNDMVMETLTAVLAVGRDLGQLRGLLPATRDSFGKAASVVRKPSSSNIGRGLGDIEPLMAELRGAARVSREGSSEDLAMD